MLGNDLTGLDVGGSVDFGNGGKAKLIGYGFNNDSSPYSIDFDKKKHDSRASRAFP